MQLRNLSFVHISIALNLRLNENMEFPDLSGEDIEWMQDSFVAVIQERIQESLADTRARNKEQAGKVSQNRVDPPHIYMIERPRTHQSVRTAHVARFSLYFQKRLSIKADKMAGLIRLRPRTLIKLLSLN